MKRKVKMRTLSAGPKGVWLAGSEYLIDEDDAEALVGGGYASYVDAVSAPSQEAMEIASVEPPERAVRARGRPRKLD